MADQAPKHKHLELLAAEGKLHIRPDQYANCPKIITIDMELFVTTLNSHLREVYVQDCLIREHYSGYGNHVSARMEEDILMLCNYAAATLYNRLRIVLEKVYPTGRTLLMNPRAPVNNSTEYPAFISSCISSIGPTRLVDSAIDTYVAYATLAANANHYGRLHATVYNGQNFERIMTALRRRHVKMAPVDFNGLNGSAFPTLFSRPNVDQTWNVYGAVHPSHYENEDIPKLILFSNALGITPFPYVGITYGCIDNEAIMTAVAALPAPADIPVGQVATSPARPVGHFWDVNYHGISPAAPADGENLALPAKMYVVGRGMDRVFTNLIASNITNTDCFTLLRERLLAA